MNSFDVNKMPLSGSILLEANAGTGKTYTLAFIYLRLIVQEGFLPQNILVVTFTKPATRELEDRLRRKLLLFRSYLKGLNRDQIEENDQILLNSLKDENKALAHLELALLCFDQHNILTINGFCERVLKQYQGVESCQPLLELVTDESKHIFSSIFSYWRVLSGHVSVWYLQFLNDQGMVPEINDQNVFYKTVQLAQNKNLMDGVASDPDFSKINQLNAQRLLLLKAWAENKVEFQKLLLQPDLFKKNTRTYKNLEKLLTGVEHFLKEGEGLKLLSDISAESIKKSLTVKYKGFVIPDFFKQFDTLVKAMETSRTDVLYQCVGYVSKDYQLLKQKRGIYSYSDQIRYTYELIKSNRNIARHLADQYPCMLIDEFQDTDSQQYHIFKTVHQTGLHQLLVMVGDPKQSIYGFRGADVFVYQLAKEMVDHSFHLNTNWRSNIDLVSFVNAFYTAHAALNVSPFALSWMLHSPSLKADKTHHVLEDEMIERSVVYVDKSMLEIQQWLISELGRLLSGQVKINGEPVVPGDIAILVNKNSEAVALYELIVQHSMPAVLWSDSSVLQTQMAEAFCYLLDCFIQPRISKIKALLLSVFFNQSLSQVSLTEDAELLAIFRGYKHALNQQALTDVLAQFYSDYDIDLNLLQRIDGERLYTDKSHIHELIEDKERNGISVSAIRNWLVEHLDKGSSTEAERRRLESDQRSVSILTIHKSKGLEFPIVFLPYIDKMRVSGNSIEQFLVSVNKNNQQCLLWNPDEEDKERAKKEAFSEKLRLLYVALTRASERLYICNKPVINSGNGKQTKGYEIANRVHQIIDQNGFADLVMKSSDVNSKVFNPRLFYTSSGAQLTIVDSVPQLEIPKQAPKITGISLLDRKLEDPLHVYSYSELNRLAGEGSPGYTLLSADEVPKVEKNIFHFPKGSSAGNCLHLIMEYVLALEVFEPSDHVKMEITRIMTRFGIATHWLPIIMHAVELWLNKPLDKQELTLNCLDRYLIEMDFFIPANSIPAQSIEHWLQRHRSQAVTFKQQHIDGYLTGAIDLIFEHQGRFYILDYKSNHLGYSSAAYEEASLHENMQAHNYDLQYLLYTVALVKHLQKTRPDFVYEKHFGGVYYLFLRGLNVGDQHGIYFAVPDAELVNDMLEHF